MARNHRLDDLTTEVELVMGRSSGNIETGREYFIELTDSRSGYVIGKLRMGAEQYARMLTGGTVDGVEGKLAPHGTYEAIGRWSWHIVVAFAFDFDGQGQEGAEERLEKALSGWGHLGVHSVSASRRRDSLTAVLRGTAPTEDGLVAAARTAAATVQRALEELPWVQRGAALPYPQEADMLRRREGL